MAKIDRRHFGRLLAAAAGGLLAAGTLPGCASGGATGDGGDANVCAGRNECKGLGGCASGDNGCAKKNSCKGKGGCAAKHHECAGKNACKSQGGCRSGDNGCAGKNSCEGKGGCQVPLKPGMASRAAGGRALA
jgi:hypothetical protein